MSMYRPQLLNLYKNLLKYTKHIPKQSEKDATLAEIRTSFKDMKTKKDQSDIEAFLQHAQGRLNFIKMLVPRMIVREMEKTAGRISYIIKDGKLVEGKAAKKEHTPYIDKRLDAEALSRHKYLLERQHFGRR